MGLCNCTQDMQKSKSLSCILSLHIGRNKVWPFPRQHSLGVLHPSHGQAACLTPLLQEGTASLEQELVLTFSELPTNCCCLTACTTSSLLPLSCVVYCIFSLVLTYCCFISLFSYLFFFFLQTQCSSLATLISVFSPYPFHFPASLPSARNLEIDFSSSAVHFCVAPSKEENALPRWVEHLLPTSHCTNITPMCREPKQVLDLLRLRSRPPNWTQMHSNTLNLGVKFRL